MNLDLLEDSQSFNLPDIEPIALLDKQSAESKLKKDSVEAKINAIANKIITKIEIISPIQLKASMFRSQLKTFRFERRKRSIFEINEEKIYKDQDAVLTAMMSLMKGYRLKRIHQFYVILSGNSAVLHFNYRKNEEKVYEPSLLISSKTINFSSELLKEGINFKKFETYEKEREKIQIEKSNILVFYGYLINMIFNQDLQFEVLSNFDFQHSLDIHPFETFNGEEKRTEFSHISKEVENLIGTKKHELYLMRMQGMWLMSNIKKLENTCSLMESLKGKHEFVYHAHPITDGIPVCMLELKVIEEINSNSLKLTKL